MVSVVFFFKQKTAYEMRISDWSSDVCSSDLHALPIKHLLFHMAGNKPAQHVRAGRCSELSGISLGNLCHRRMINDDPVGIMTPLPMFRHDEKQRSQDEEMQQRLPQQPRAPTPQIGRAPGRETEGTYVTI